MFFESHSHYDDSRYDCDRHELIRSLKSKDVEYIVNVGADIPSSAASVELATQYDFIYASVGVHPHEADSLTEEGLSLLRELAHNNKVVAIGEIGLDFYYDHSPRDTQRKWFIRQLELAKELKLPVIIHSRDAAAETYNIIKASGLREGVIHCFSGSPQIAADYIRLGFYIGMGGVVTFPKSRVAVEVISAIPLEKLLIETDCPYLSPAPKRGQRNDSSNLVYIAKKIAEIKNNTLDEISEITKSNAKKCFRLNTDAES